MNARLTSIDVGASETYLRGNFIRAFFDLHDAGNKRDMLRKTAQVLLTAVDTDPGQGLVIHTTNVANRVRHARELMGRIPQKEVPHGVTELLSHRGEAELMLAAWGHMGRNDDPMIMNEVDRMYQQFGQPSGQQVLDLAKTLADEKRVGLPDLSEAAFSVSRASHRPDGAKGGGSGSGQAGMINIDQLSEKSFICLRSDVDKLFHRDRLISSMSRFVTVQAIGTQMVCFEWHTPIYSTDEQAIPDDAMLTS